jgi:two-component system, chemotaxis family, sensor kinase Cph1
MREILKQLKKEIDTDEITADKKAKLVEIYRNLSWQFEKYEFQHSRNINDKSISVNILKATVEQLEAQKILVLEKTQEIERNLNDLKQAYEELEQYTQIASHDLKSPLRTIGNYAQLLSKRFKIVLNDEGQEYLNHILRGVKHMADIITELLEYSKTERNSNAENIDIQSVIHEVVVKLIQQKGYDELHLIISAKPIEIIGHKQDIETIFTELINNAIKFRSQKPPCIIIEAKTETKGTVLFSIADNGVGLDEKFNEKAFLPFQRIAYLDRPGVGIGLAKCKKSVLKHGGQIWYKQNRLSGTTFFFTIPAIEAGKLIQ